MELWFALFENLPLNFLNFFSDSRHTRYDNSARWYECMHLRHKQTNILEVFHVKNATLDKR